MDTMTELKAKLETQAEEMIQDAEQAMGWQGNTTEESHKVDLLEKLRDLQMSISGIESFDAVDFSRLPCSKCELYQPSLGLAEKDFNRDPSQGVFYVEVVLSESHATQCPEQELVCLVTCHYSEDVEGRVTELLKDQAISDHRELNVSTPQRIG